jgi:transcriptional regulator with XRE-family HTH domain
LQRKSKRKATTERERKMPGFTYKSYSFKDKDPIIDYLRTIISDSKKSNKVIADESGVSANTIRKWLYGDTRRPQAASINAVLRALSYKLNISPIGAPMLIIPTAIEPKAVDPKIRRRIGAAKYSNVHHISVNRKKK